MCMYIRNMFMLVAELWKFGVCVGECVCQMVLSAFQLLSVCGCGTLCHPHVFTFAHTIEMHFSAHTLAALPVGVGRDTGFCTELVSNK